MGKKKPVLPPEPPFTIKEYESSTYWRKKSAEILDNKDIVCSICGRKRWYWLPRARRWKKKFLFSCHHITYDNIPNEKLGRDIAVCCGLCHTTSHDLLRLRSLGGMYELLAQIVEQYFKYDSESYKKANEKWGKKE